MGELLPSFALGDSRLTKFSKLFYLPNASFMCTEVSGFGLFLIWGIFVFTAIAAPGCKGWILTKLEVAVELPWLVIGDLEGLGIRLGVIRLSELRC